MSDRAAGDEAAAQRRHRPVLLPAPRARRAAARRARSKSADDDVPSRLVGGGLKTLLYMAQLASISMDPWFSRVDALRHADQVAIDLDPSRAPRSTQILDVARWVHEELERSAYRRFPKTSGSEGLHIFIPLPGGHAVRGRHAVLPDRRDDGGERSIRRWPPSNGR